VRHFGLHRIDVVVLLTDEVGDFLVRGDERAIEYVLRTVRLLALIRLAASAAGRIDARAQRTVAAGLEAGTSLLRPDFLNGLGELLQVFAALVHDAFEVEIRNGIPDDAEIDGQRADRRAPDLCDL